MVTPSLILFYAAAALTLGGALGVVLTRNIVYAAFALLASLIGVAGLFLLAFAEFLALVQLLIYGGAIVIVILFALMLTRIQDFERITDNRQWPIAAIVALGVLGLLVASVLATSTRTRTGPDGEPGPPGRGVRSVRRHAVRAVGRAVRGGLAHIAGRADWSRHPCAQHRRARLIELAHFQVLSAALFAIGLYGVLAKRSAVLILMSIELMLNAVNINLIGFSAFMDFAEPQRALGHVIVVFVITIAAAELALAIAIILRLYRNRSSVNVDELDLLKW